MAADIYSKAGADAAFLHDTVAGRKALAQSPEITGTFVAGRIVDENDDPVTEYRLVARSLSTNPLEIDELWIEAVE